MIPDSQVHDPRLAGARCVSVKHAAVIVQDDARLVKARCLARAVLRTVRAVVVAGYVTRSRGTAVASIGRNSL